MIDLKHANMVIWVVVFSRERYKIRLILVRNQFFFVMGSHPKQGPAGQAIFYYIMRFYGFITLFGQGVKGLRDLRKAQNNTEA